MIVQGSDVIAGNESIAPVSSRERIVLTARALFVERGYASVSMQQLADATGLRKASLYHHFRSKEALFAEVMGVELDRLMADYAGVHELNGAIGEQLEWIALVNYRQFAQPEFYQLVKDFLQHVPESGHVELHGRLREMEGFFAELFAQAIARGEIERVDPHHAATMFFHMMMALANDPTDFRIVPPPPAEEAAKLVTRVMLRGLGRRCAE